MSQQEAFGQLIPLLEPQYSESLKQIVSQFSEFDIRWIISTIRSYGEGSMLRNVNYDNIQNVINLLILKLDGEEIGVGLICNRRFQ